MDRRSFLYRLGLFSGGLAAASGSLTKRAEVLAQTGDLSNLRASGYGALVPAAAKNTGETYLALPKGFEYNIIGKTGAPMSDNNKTPAKHDGMAAFKVRGELRVVRNHEITNGKLPVAGSPIGANPYDETAGGGATTLVINPKTREIVRDFVSLSGTLVNCAGGATPWGSWISCEETTLGPALRTLKDGKKIGGFAKPHGYCFEVSASANSSLPACSAQGDGTFRTRGSRG